MSDPTAFAAHCTAMATAEHKPDCRGHRPSRWGWVSEVHPNPTCPGCVTDADRELWAALVAEVEAYRAPLVDLFGAAADEPTPMRDEAEEAAR